MIYPMHIQRRKFPLRKCFGHSLCLFSLLLHQRTFCNPIPHDKAVSFRATIFLISSFHTLWCYRVWWSNRMIWSYYRPQPRIEYTEFLKKSGLNQTWILTNCVFQKPRPIVLLLQSRVSRSNRRADPSLASVWQWDMQSRYAAQHLARVAKLSKAMYHALIEQDGGEFLARTGALVRDRHLRTKRNRVAFQQIVHLCHEGENLDTSRFWTYSVVRNAIKRAMENMEHFYTKHFCIFPMNDFSTWSWFVAMILFNS